MSVSVRAGYISGGVPVPPKKPSDPLDGIAFLSIVCIMLGAYMLNAHWYALVALGAFGLAVACYAAATRPAS